MTTTRTYNDDEIHDLGCHAPLASALISGDPPFLRFA